jgi:hypothetical protein
LTRWLDELDLLVVPSRCVETGPLTLLEAWDREVPVIGANLGGIREFLLSAGLDKLLFSPDDAVSLAQAVRRTATWVGPSPQVTIEGVEELVAWMVDVYAACAATSAGHVPA